MSHTGKIGQVSPAIVLLVLAAILLSGCTGDGDATDQATPPEPIALEDRPRQYDARWLINAEAVGADGPGYSFQYREVVDDRTGRYLVQSPNHVATQAPDEVVLCAAIFRTDPYCASTKRPDNTPPVYSYPLQLLRGWGPFELYDLAGWRELDLVSRTEPDAWNRRSFTVGDIPVECFTVVGDTSAARTGFEVCYTNDDLHLVASVDLQGDLIYEIDLQFYERVVDDDSFETGLEEFIEAKASLQDQLIALFPDIPASRPSPTPDRDS